MTRAFPKQLSERACVGKVQSLVDQGQFFLAHDFAQAALESYPASWQLQHQRSLALAQVGATEEAQQLLGAFLQDANLRAAESDDHGEEELIGLQGRLYKDLWTRTGRVEDLKTSCDNYVAGFTTSGGTYTGINSASLSWILGKFEFARKTAKVVLDICERLPPVDSQGDSEAYWRPATIGEAELLLGNTPQACAAYETAVTEARGRHRFVAASRRQLLLLRDNGLEVPESILTILKPPTSVVFVGDAIASVNDQSTKAYANLEAAVRYAIERLLDSEHVSIGFSSVVSGADLLFVEAMLDRGGEVNIVLPFDTEDLVPLMESRVGPAWERRFQDVISRATTVSFAMKERYLGDDSLFDFCNQVLTGLGRFHARNLLAEARLIAAIDRGTSTESSHATRLVRQWPDEERKTLIDLSEIRESVSRNHNLLSRNGPEIEVLPIGTSGTHSARIVRKIRSLLFADLKHFTKIGDEGVPDFLNFLAEIAGYMEGIRVQPDYLRTTGDGVFAVMSTATDMAQYALSFGDATRHANSVVSGLIGPLLFRTALHVAPVYATTDPLNRQPTYFGTDVNRAARLEPVTVPGEIYATEQFVALLETEQLTSSRWRDAEYRPWKCEYLGMLQLAKDFDSQRVYHLRKNTMKK